jgi:hypothetical protein
MQTITLYRYIRPNGGVTVSTVKPDAEYTELTRLFADEGYTLTDGVNYTSCIDTDNPDAWVEVEYTEGQDEPSEVEQKAHAYDILMGVSE